MYITVSINPARLRKFLCCLLNWLSKFTNYRNHPLATVDDTELRANAHKTGFSTDKVQIIGKALIQIRVSSQRTRPNYRLNSEGNFCVFCNDYLKLG